MIAYLDTNIVVWLAQGSLDRISQKAQEHLNEAELLLSPMVLLELEYLFEVKRLRIGARDIFLKIEHELGVRRCDFTFSSIVSAALDEKWTRDPFDRMIVAHAKANGFANLISADEEISQHYPRTIW